MYFGRMDFHQEILHLIDQAQTNHLCIDNAETLKVLQAIQKVSSSALLLKKAIVLFTIAENKTTTIPCLSDRERQIFNLIGCEFKSREIASILSISEATVSTHRKNIIRKLKITGSRQLQLFAFREVQQEFRRIKN